MRVFEITLILLAFTFFPMRLSAEPNEILMSCVKDVYVSYGARENNVSEEFVRDVISKTPDLINIIKNIALQIEQLHNKGSKDEVELNIKATEIEMPGTSAGFLSCYEEFKMTNPME